MENLPNKVLREIRTQAVEAIQEYCNHITIGSESEDGEFSETMVPQMIILLVEAFRLNCVVAWYESGEELTIDECTEHAMRAVVDVALPNARADLKIAKKWAKEGYPSPDGTDADPFDMVEKAIKDAQKHASS